MGLTRISLTRPVFILMVIFGLVLLGAISFRSLNQEYFPSINTPVVTISTIYAGAAPDDVERQITKPIEDSVSGLSNVDFIQSTSSEGRSLVTVTFKDKANDALIANDVERRISAIRGVLPTDAGAPTVAKFDFTQSAIMYLALSGDAPLADVFRFADDTIRPRFEAVDGVAQVAVSGGVAREIQVQVDPKRLAAYNLTLDQVGSTLARENLSRPGGSIPAGDRELNVRLTGLLQSPEDIGKLNIQAASGLIPLREVATIVDTTKKQTSLDKYNGKTAVSLLISKSSTANEIRVSEQVRKEIANMQADIPAGMNLDIVFDQTKFTVSSLDGVNRSLLEAICITGLVLLIFLHTFRSTAIVLFAIPTSMLTTFLWMNVLGFTLNVMSTLALVLVIGVLVDDSIVVIENIVRHLKLGETPWQAALNGRSEIGLAAIAITLVDVVIFLPVGFLSGTTGGFFKQFGLVIVAAVLTSLFISFTLTPMLASRWLNANAIKRPRGPWGWFIHGFDSALDGLERLYRRVLRVSLRFRYIPPIVAFITLILSFGLVATGKVKFEFVPTSDSGLFTISTELPAGSTLDATARLLDKIQGEVSAIPEVDKYLWIAGSAEQSSGPRFGQYIVVLKDVHQRKRDVFTIIDDLKPRVEGLDGAIVRVGSGQGFGGSPVDVRVQGQDRKAIEQVASQIEQLVRETPGTATVRNSAATGNPEFRLAVDRDRLADFRLTADQVASALRTAVDGTVVTKFRPENQNEVDVRVITTPDTRTSVQQIGDVPLTVVRDGQAVQVKLGQVTSVVEVPGPVSLVRRNRLPQANVTASLVGTTALNDVTTPISAKVTAMRQNLPLGITIDLGGQAQAQAEAFGQLLFALGLSIILIYMLLAALYESFIMPFATMFALPVALIGAFLGLAITGNTINILSIIGFIVLMGLVGKNGILLVDYTNTLRQRGRTRLEALLEAGPTRLRPIIMTSTALCFGLFPIASKLEEGSAIYAGIGALVIGGMITSTLLSLIVVPTMYTFFDDFQTLLVRFFQWRPFRRRGKSERKEEPVVGGVETGSTVTG